MLLKVTLRVCIEGLHLRFGLVHHGALWDGVSSGLNHEMWTMEWFV